MLDLLYACTPTVTWSDAGLLPEGYARVEQFGVLPMGGGRTFIVSLSGRKGAAAAVTSYNALRHGSKRIARRIVGLGLRTGLAQPLLRMKVVDVGVQVDASHERVAADLLSAHLCQLFDVRSVVIAAGGSRGPYRKPVLQVFSQSGTPLGYVKVGWNDWTRDGVRREARALAACAGRPIQIGVPAVLGTSTWQGFDLLVSAPLPEGVQGLGRAAKLPAAAVLREIAGLSHVSVVPVAASQWWHGVRSRIRTNVTDATSRSALDRVADLLERRYGHVPLEFGFCHGDLVPWNLARLGGRLYAWDWESSTPDAPLGFDAVHFYFQVAFVARGQALGTAAAFAAAASLPALRDLGVPAASFELVATLHLIELFLRHEEARSAATDADERFYPAIKDVLQRRLTRLWAPASAAVGGVA